MHNQLPACWMRNGCKIQKISLNLVWLTLEQVWKLFLPLRRLPLKKKKLFQYECKQIIDPQKMVQSNSTVSLRFKKLAGNLWTLNKISSKIADNAKFEYDSFQSVAIKKHSEFFLTCGPRKERLDVFLGKYVRREFENFWHICKVVFIFLYGQSFVECVFSVNNLTIDDNI